MSATDTLTYHCPHCHAVVDAREDLIGKVVDCPAPDCGRPFRLEAPSAVPLDADALRNEHAAHATVTDPADDESVVTEVHPVAVRRHLGQATAVLALLVLGVAALMMGVISQPLILGEAEVMAPAALTITGGALLAAALGIFAVWWIRARMTTLIVTSERTILRKGLISRDSSEVRHQDVRNLQVDQSFVQRMLGIGDLAISSSGQDDLEIEVRGIPDPGSIAEMVRNRQ